MYEILHKLNTIYYAVILEVNSCIKLSELK